MDGDENITDFEGAGVKEGINVWVIKSTNVIEAIPPNEHGQFDETLTYLCLHTHGTPPQSWDVYFWLGAEASPDRHCLAALKAMDLDKYLKYRTNMHREVQEHESAGFLAMFKGKIRYQKGNAQAILKSTAGNVTKRLYHVKGKKHCRVVEVPFAFNSLNQDDVFILDVGDRIFVWNGPHANNGEKVKGAEVARNIRDFERAGRAKIEFIDDEWDSHPDFFSQLGCKPLPAVTRATDSDEEFEKRSNVSMQLYRVSDASGTLVIEPITGKLSYKNLDTDDCFFLDTGSAASGLYAWLGKNCTEQERKAVWDNALAYLKRKRLPLHTPICKINENHEPALFRALLNFPPKKVERHLQHSLSQGIASIDPNEKFDVTKMQISRKQSICQAIDDSTGKKKVWRVAAFDIHLLPETDHGIFYAGDSYIILYTSEKVQGGIIYYWLGNHSTIDEKATAAMFVNKIDELECKGKAMQMRVIQFKEPEHFIKMFGNVLVILKGGVESGFKSPKTAIRDFQKTDDTCQMFQIRGRRIVEVGVEAKNLNSNDIFFVKTTAKQGYTWIGKGASQEEQETAVKVPVIFDLVENKQIAEGDEPTSFWYLLGGKEAYAKGARLEDPSPEYASRLFHCSNARGKFIVEEIVDFTQQDLESDDVMILDTFDEIYVWLGQNSNIEEKKAALDTVLRYVAADISGRTEENTNLLVVKQKFEPTTFKAHFGIWDEHLWDNELGYDKLKELITRNVDFIHDPKNEPLQVREMEAEFTKTHPAEVLRAKPDQLPFGVDATNKERHLREEDFEKVFGMPRMQYESLPKWKQIQHKKRVGLF